MRASVVAGAGLTRTSADQTSVHLFAQTDPVPEEPPELIVPDQDAWREWLAAHHGEQRGV